MGRIIFLFLFFNLNAYAFKFAPMSSTINLKSNNVNAIFYLENDSDTPIAIQVSILKREMDLNGVETNLKIKDELSLYPSQLIIPANEKRSVKVFWAGKEKPLKELAYRLMAEQLPIDLEKGKSPKASIKVLLRYAAALYVLPDNFSSNVVFEEIKNENKKIMMMVSNNGKKHQVLTNLHLKIINEKTKDEIHLLPDDLKGMTGENVLAESKRIFTFLPAGKLLEISSTNKIKFSIDKD